VLKNINFKNDNVETFLTVDHTLQLHIYTHSDHIEIASIFHIN